MVALAVSSGSALADSVSTRDLFTQGGTGLAGISCPTARLCVAVGQQGGIDSPNVVYAVSCTRSGFCAAVDGAGRVLTSTEPTGGKRAWRARKISRNPLYAVSCASSRLCAALDSKGYVLSCADTWAARARGTGFVWAAAPTHSNPFPVRGHLCVWLGAITPATPTHITCRTDKSPSPLTPQAVLAPGGRSASIAATQWRSRAVRSAHDLRPGVTRW